jgi:WD40 repeat protein
MKNETNFNRILLGVILPIGLFTALTVAAQFLPTSWSTVVVTCAVIVGMLCFGLLPFNIHAFLASFLNAREIEKWQRYSLQIAVASLAPTFSLALIDRSIAFLVYGVSGAVSLLVAGVHWLCAVYTSKRSPSSEIAPPAAVPKPPLDANQNVREAKKLCEFKHGGFYEQHIVFSSCGEFLATWEPDKIQLFCLRTEEQIGSLTGPRVPVCVSAEQLVTTGNGSIEAWSVPALKNVKTISSPTPQDKCPQGSWKTLSLGEGRTVYVAATGNGSLTPVQWQNDWSLYNPYRMCYSEAANTIFAALGDCAGILCPRTGKTEWRSPSAGRDVPAVAVGKDGKFAAFGSMDGSVFLVDVKKRQVFQRLLIPGEIRCLAFANDGAHLAAGCGDHLSDVLVCDTTPAIKCSVKIGYSNNWAVAFSPQGDKLAVGSDNGVLSLWDWR